jgi:hypothetical protein
MCSLRKIQLQDFLFQKWLERPFRASFAPLFLRKQKLRKRNKHEFWVKRGGLDAFVAQNSTTRFFVPKVARTALPGEFHTVVPRKPKLRKHNKYVFWVKWGGLGASVAKNSTEDFVFQKSLERPSRSYFATLYGRKPKLGKRNKHEFWVKRGGLGAFVVKNSTARLFVPKVARTALPGAFRIVVPSKTETSKMQQT